MRDIDLTPKAIILEKEGKNTAPAIALSAYKAIEENARLFVIGFIC